MSTQSAMELLRAAQEGDSEACEQAVLENSGLIWSIVRRYPAKISRQCRSVYT